MIRKTVLLAAAILIAANPFHADAKETCPPCPQIGRTSSLIEGGYGSSGSCSLIGKDLVLTCVHVLRGECRVLIDGEVYKTEIVALDLKNDWAILRLDRECPLDPLSVASGMPDEGEKLWGFGYGPFPEGELWGVNRCVWKDGKLYGRFYPGDSGGALCDNEGRIIGVCTSFVPSTGTCNGHGIGQLKSFIDKYKDHAGQGVVVQR